MSIARTTGARSSWRNTKTASRLSVTGTVLLSTAEHKGFALGMEEGMAKGMEEGEKNKALAIAKEMLSDGMSVDSVARYTNLPVEDIEQLQKL